MTAFVMENFGKTAEYLHYADPADDYRARFVARFKHNVATMPSFKTFISKNFSVEEYFGLMDMGMTPLKIAEEKGYMSANVRKALKASGYPMTLAGKAAYLREAAELGYPSGLLRS